MLTSRAGRAAIMQQHALRCAAAAAEDADVINHRRVSDEAQYNEWKRAGVGVDSASQRLKMTAMLEYIDTYIAQLQSIADERKSAWTDVICRGSYYHDVDGWGMTSNLRGEIEESKVWRFELRDGVAIAVTAAALVVCSPIAIAQVEADAAAAASAQRELLEHRAHYVAQCEPLADAIIAKVDADHEDDLARHAINVAKYAVGTLTADVIITLRDERGGGGGDGGADDHAAMMAHNDAIIATITDDVQAGVDRSRSDAARLRYTADIAAWHQRIVDVGSDAQSASVMRDCLYRVSAKHASYLGFHIATLQWRAECRDVERAAVHAMAHRDIMASATAALHAELVMAAQSRNELIRAARDAFGTAEEFDELNAPKPSDASCSDARGQQRVHTFVEYVKDIAALQRERDVAIAATALQRVVQRAANLVNLAATKAAAAESNAALVVLHAEADAHNTAVFEATRTTAVLSSRCRAAGRKPNIIEPQSFDRAVGLADRWVEAANDHLEYDRMRDESEREDSEWRSTDREDVSDERGGGGHAAVMAHSDTVIAWFTNGCVKSDAIRIRTDVRLELAADIRAWRQRRDDDAQSAPVMRECLTRVVAAYVEFLNCRITSLQWLADARDAECVKLRAAVQRDVGIAANTAELRAEIAECAAWRDELHAACDDVSAVPADTDMAPPPVDDTFISSPLRSAAKAKMKAGTQRKMTAQDRKRGGNMTRAAAGTSGAATLAAASVVQVGSRRMNIGTQLVEMTDSTSDYLAGRYDVLRTRLAVDGFLFVRGVIPTPVATAARAAMIGQLDASGAIRVPAGCTTNDAHIQRQAVWNAAHSPSGRKRKSSSSSQSMIAGWVIDAESGGAVDASKRAEHTAAEIAAWRGIGTGVAMKSVYDGAALAAFYARILASADAPATTLPGYTWLRAKGPSESTAVHADLFYFRRDTQMYEDHWRAPASAASSASAAAASSSSSSSSSAAGDACTCNDAALSCRRCCALPLPFWTCWISLSDIAATEGRLAVIPGSHKLSGYDEPDRGNHLPSGYTPAYARDAVWQTPTRIGIGDVILFNMKTMHAATKNGGDRYRISLDTRVTTSQVVDTTQSGKKRRT